MINFIDQQDRLKNKTKKNDAFASLIIFHEVVFSPSIDSNPYE